MKKTGAFTLVEILVTLVFLGVVLPAVVSALLLANRASVSADRSSLALQLAQNELSELLVGEAWASSAGSGDFGADYPGYRWAFSQRTWPEGAMTELTLEVKYRVQGREESLRLVTLATEEATGAPASSALP